MSGSQAGPVVRPAARAVVHGGGTARGAAAGAEDVEERDHGLVAVVVDVLGVVGAHPGAAPPGGHALVPPLVLEGAGEPPPPPATPRCSRTRRGVVPFFFSHQVLAIEEAMWQPVVGECGRVYFHNTSTDETSWDNPLRSMLQDTQNFAEDVLEIARRRVVRVSVDIGICSRLSRMFRRWTEVTQSTHVQSLVHGLDAWMRLRTILQSTITHRNTIMEELAVERLRSSETLSALIRERVDRASHAFDVGRPLQRSLRTSRPE